MTRAEDSGRNGDAGQGVAWGTVESAAPEFAERVRRRFAAFRHHVLATLRTDGAPRLTGLEADFRYGELWLGMLPDSRKALDLGRDSRFALHANPGPGADLADGDVRVSGRAVEVGGGGDGDVDGLMARYARDMRPPEPFRLFRAELTEVVRTSTDAPFLVLETWRPGGPLRTVRRRSR